ncbi:mitotic checkpoint serine/threonine-protein kinase BUB1 [Heracleum sosnowskyi]|uniref:Mitotic checkpoint serine/threonine-protein kinase BUB1 n=1 Tax=Heracleum sosnowskyi TaxID=360622 RepID=A0AAD8IHR7_9APIA|nr:mitotic checkpoint serine/threonine-protein kinase BUB1 [Heracleum sosnowskyi]
MTAVSDFPADTTADPLLPWLRSIAKLLINIKSSSNDAVSQLHQLAIDCTRTFKNDVRYQNDVRFLKVWFLYMDGSSDFKTIFGEMQQCNICVQNAMLYESYALFLEAKEMLRDAHYVYQLGISRNAEPVERLKKGLALFYDRMTAIVNAGSEKKKIDSTVMLKCGEIFVNPWSTSTITNLLQKMKAKLSKYKGYYSNAKAYPGKVALSTLEKSVRRNKVIIDIGGKKYQIIGCSGQGGFAQVFKAHVNSNPEDVVALKIQKPAFPWEFYMYRQLDMRILGKERSSFGVVHRVDLYSDYSMLVSDFLSHGTLQDAINSNAVIGGCMAEVLCIYYTIELLSMLETLHGSRIVHGDFKPDNLLIRYARDDLTEDDFLDRTGPWEDQGLCLVDWGRGIDLSLFPEKTKFMGDCRTSGFRCIEMQENKPWTFQVDIYGLCVIVHMMLHNSYMETEKKMSSDGIYIYLPKAPFKRYWQTDLWKNLFEKLLNTSPDDDHIELLRSIRKSFQDYMCSKPQRIKDLKQSLVKQRQSMCST